MKKLLFIFIILTSSISTHAQITFEKGYFITDSDEKIECFIKNIDWKNNPIAFQYQLSENTESKTKTIKSVKEFGILNSSKYIKSIVKIDRSSEVVSEMSNDKNPTFKEEVLFLKVLLEGKASLYRYTDSNLKRYFYSKDTSRIKQLIFKNYLTKNHEIGKNERFKQQLWKNLKCKKTPLKEINNLEYKKSSLVNFFRKYNQCINSDFTNFEQKQKKDLLNLTIRPGIQRSSLSTNHTTSKYRNIDFNNEFGFRLGLEAEYILPFNKNKWAIIIEPTYQYYKTTKEITLISNTTNTSVNYQSIEIPIGIRHYSFLPNGSKLFFNTSIVLDFPLSSTLTSERKGFIDLDIESAVNLTLGIGYHFRNNYNIELRYGFGREILNNYLTWSSDYKSLSLIFGYTLF